MASSANPRPNRVKVKTTIPTKPFPLNSSRPTVTTDRLILRALVPEDVHGLHILRTQPEIMANNPQGRLDKDLEETKPKLALYLAPKDETTFYFATCLKETGEMVGLGGCYSTSSLLGWPVIGYMIRKELWGQGLVTEFVHAFMDIWWKLPRAEVEIEVDPRTLSGAPDGDGRVREQMSTWTTTDNIGSQRVLEKSGFEHYLTWREPDLRNPEIEVVLEAYRVYPN